MFRYEKSLSTRPSAHKALYKKAPSFFIKKRNGKHTRRGSSVNEEQNRVASGEIVQGVLSFAVAFMPLDHLLDVNR